MVHKHTYFDCQEISGTKKKKDTQRLDKALNLYSDLDLEHNNPIFTQDTPANDDVPSD